MSLRGLAAGGVGNRILVVFVTPSRMSIDCWSIPKPLAEAFGKASRDAFHGAMLESSGKHPADAK